MITLDADLLSQNLSFKECVDQLESLYFKEAGELESQPQRTLTRINSDSLIFTMPGYSKKLGRFAVKIVSEYKKNPKLFRRRIQGGLVILFDSNTSEPLALIDSPRLTAIRTGALCGLATELLSRRDSKSVGIIGSGEQARALLEGACTVRPVREVRVFSLEFSHARNFAKEMSRKLGVPVEAVSEKKELCKEKVDILNLATNSSRPVLDWKDDVSSGMHINSIGTLPERQELDVDTIRNSRLFVDTKDGVLREAGDLINAIKVGKINESHILGDLSVLVSKRATGRKDSTDVTLFKSVGFSLLDVYAASKAYENASRK
jgi:ornithine cyclodeaminase